MDTEGLIEVMESGHLAGYAGDVWYPQPAPAGDPWRKMPSRAVTLRLSATSLGAQKRYSGGIKDCLGSFFPGESIDPGYIILKGGWATSPNYGYTYES